MNSIKEPVRKNLVFFYIFLFCKQVSCQHDAFRIGNTVRNSLLVPPFHVMIRDRPRGVQKFIRSHGGRYLFGRFL